ncbi:Solute carrier family 22 member 12 [Trichoplax sp. H2]|nr:Solute carrier family 22 member 12 [Trichoplax sp. H2]|eukprot:RDD36932.1 Solute carrier family 22 member 12 [Trichoplax sp. H2]
MLNSSWEANHPILSDVSFCQTGESLKKVITDILIGNLFSIPVAIICLLLVNRAGRKWLYCPMITICGLSILLMLLIDNELSVLILGCLFTSISNNVWIAYKTWSSELFPTTVRSTAIGILNLIGHTGSILGMTIFALLFYKSCTATLIIFSFLGLLSGFAALFLPDTTNVDIS